MGEAKRRRELPRFREWLVDNITSDNAAGRDEYADFADWVAQMLDHAKPDDPQHARLLRMTQAASLAIVEVSNHEVKAGTDVATISLDMCRCLGLSFGYALMSLSWKDETPFRSFAHPFAEQFRDGFKFAVDACLSEDDASPGDTHHG